MEDTTKLNKSKLGTKQYWDEFYAVERENFEKNPEDTGECWFNDNDAEEKMVEFLVDSRGMRSISEQCSMIDLGTGNGHLLFAMHENGFDGPMCGVDYSEQSVQFAREIVQERGYGDNFKFEQADIFDSKWRPGEFDVVLDKGTLDAIALSGLTFDDGKKTIVDVYSQVIEKLLKPDGVFLITSCNFTQDELINIIESDSLELWETVDYPSFEFGGVKGQTICTVAFTKKK
ncbi:Protein-lysine N-methyltransferase EFM4 [Nakaseomyces bracarensis]|uniref:Protein-lysine N-methyltransferase EFM4 n=1 Tax=Nakaseomyces bracarensis TaxID=273131 RepID=A0ABR4NRM6_9SACH